MCRLAFSACLSGTPPPPALGLTPLLSLFHHAVRPLVTPSNGCVSRRAPLPHPPPLSPPLSPAFKDGQAIKDGVRQRVNKWRHELAPSFRSSSLASSPSSSSSSSSSSSTPASSSTSTSAAKAGGSSGSGRSGGADVLPFLIPLARLARQLEIDAASYTARWVLSKRRQFVCGQPARIGETGKVFLAPVTAHTLNGWQQRAS